MCVLGVIGRVMGGGFVAGWGGNVVRSVSTVVYVYMYFYWMDCIQGMLSVHSYLCICICVRVCVRVCEYMYVSMYECT